MTSCSFHGSPGLAVSVYEEGVKRRVHNNTSSYIITHYYLSIPCAESMHKHTMHRATSVQTTNPMQGMRNHDTNLFV